MTIEDTLKDVLKEKELVQLLVNLPVPISSNKESSPGRPSMLEILLNNSDTYEDRRLGSDDSALDAHEET